MRLPPRGRTRRRSVRPVSPKGLPGPASSTGDPSGRFRRVVHLPVHEVCRVPRGPAPGRARALRRRLRLPELPRDRELGDRHVRPRSHGDGVGGGPHPCVMRGMPSRVRASRRRARLGGPRGSVRRLSRRSPRDPVRSWRCSTRLSPLSYPGSLGDAGVRPRSRFDFPRRWRARAGSVLGLPPAGGNRRREDRALSPGARRLQGLSRGDPGTARAGPWSEKRGLA